MMFWYGSHWVFWQAALMWVGMVVFWGAIIWLGWYLVSSWLAETRRDSRTGNAKAILDERLARGEIDAEEYRRLSDLMRNENVHAGNGRNPVSAGER